MNETDHTPLTADELAEIRQRAEQATPGPWRWVEVPSNHSLDYPRDAPDAEWDEQDGELLTFDELRGTDRHVLTGVWGNDGTGSVGVDHPADGRFIAHAREDIPRLLAEVARLRAALQSQEMHLSALWHSAGAPTFTAMAGRGVIDAWLQEVREALSVDQTPG